MGCRGENNGRIGRAARQRQYGERSWLRMGIAGDGERSGGHGSGWKKQRAEVAKEAQQRRCGNVRHGKGGAERMQVGGREALVLFAVFARGGEGRSPVILFAGLFAK